MELIKFMQDKIDILKNDFMKQSEVLMHSFSQNDIMTLGAIGASYLAAKTIEREYKHHDDAAKEHIHSELMDGNAYADTYIETGIQRYYYNALDELKHAQGFIDELPQTTLEQKAYYEDMINWSNSIKEKLDKYKPMVTKGKEAHNPMPMPMQTQTQTQNQYNPNPNPIGHSDIPMVGIPLISAITANKDY